MNKEFIVGFPKGKEKVKENIELYTNMQDAVSATDDNAIGITCTNLEEAKDKFFDFVTKEINNEISQTKDIICTTIKDFQIEANRIAEEKGFWNYYNIFNPIKEGNQETAKWVREQHICTKIALVIIELSEAIEARIKGKIANIKGYISDIENNSLDNIRSFEHEIKDSYEDELADACIRLFDLAEKTGVDLTWHIQQKMIYNSTRPKMHGKKY